MVDWCLEKGHNARATPKNERRMPRLQTCLSCSWSRYEYNDGNIRRGSAHELFYGTTTNCNERKVLGKNKTTLLKTIIEEILPFSERQNYNKYQ